MTSKVYIAIAVAALMLASGLAGWAWRGEKCTRAVTAATTDTATCVSASQATDAVLARVDANERQQKAQHEDAMKAADTAVANRPAEIADSTRRAQRRATNIAQSPHDDANCSALASLPVCAAVADQLWAGRSEAAGGGSTHRD